MSAEDFKWYVVKSVSGKEKKTKEYIQSEIGRAGFESQVENILIPTEKVIQIRKGKKINKDRIFFPGYIMIKADLRGEILHVIKMTPNVIGFLGETKGGDPIPLRESEVVRMLGQEDKFSMNKTYDQIPFLVGETIKVIDGPFNGFNGSIEKVNQEKQKLEVIVKIFGRKTPLELSYMQVEKI